MPPAVSDDETSEVEVTQVESKTEKSKPAKRAAVSEPGKQEILLVEDNEEDAEEEAEEEDEEDLDEDEYIVEAIKNHIIDEGVIKFQVKWKGWEKKTDLTWEPEESLTETASEILNAYYESVGGRDFVLNAKLDEEFEKEGKTKKRGRQSTGAPTNGKKRKAEKDHPKSGTPPASVTRAFKPPSGSWEEDVSSIDACEDTNGNVMVFLQWKTGERTQHPLQQVYSRCPQKMLKFYEAHLVFKKGGGTPIENSVAGD